MKIQIKNQSAESASALIITLVLGVIMLVIMVSYLRLIGSQNGLVLRSESSNASLTMAEAGVEEALAQLNNSPNNFATNGWGGAGGVFGPVVRTLDGGSYSVIISNASLPVIYSTGIAIVPVKGDSISRTVRVGVLKQSLANIGVGTRKTIDFNGNVIAVDSWNSHSTNLSTGGLFDPNKTSTNGNVASMGGAVNIGNNTIKGSLYLGPTATLDGNSGTITGQIYKDANIDFPDVVLPSAAWQTAPLSGGTHSFTNSGYYTVSDQYPINVQSGVTVTLNVTTAVSYNPSSVQIHGSLTNSGTANIYLNGPPSLKVSGNTAVDASNRPENLRYYGLPSLTSVDLSGSSAFVGVLYAPEAAVSLSGGGDLIGSLVADSIKMNGGYVIHYDESLGTNGLALFVVQSWQEL